MNAEPEIQEYLDEPTGIRMTVEYDHPSSPRVTAYLPELCTLETDEINAAIRRLLKIVERVVSSSEQAPQQGEHEHEQ